MEKQKPLYIFAVAPQISLEASQSLLRRSTLHFDGDEENRSNIYDPFANISVTLDANLGIVHENSERADKIYHQIVSESVGFDDIYLCGGDLLYGFTGAETAREVAQLHFGPIGSYHAVFSRFEDQPPLICSNELRDTIKQLVGFRQVVMVLEFVVKAGSANWEARCAGGARRNNNAWDSFLCYIDVDDTDPFDSQDKECFQRLTADVGKDFKKDLGSFTTRFVDRPNGDFAGIITYHPRKASDTRGKAAMAEGKFSQMMEKMVKESLDEERAAEERRHTGFKMKEFPRCLREKQTLQAKQDKDAN